jgi:uncharacterized protein with HEPN domain
MTHNDQQRLEDILEFAERAVRIAGDLPLSRLIANEEKYYAVRYCLQVIGECVKDLSPEATKGMSAIPWREIKAMRDRLVHGYKAISGEVVYETVRLDLPALIEAVRQYLSTDSDEAP